MSHIASEGAAIALAYVFLFYVDAINNARIWWLRKNETYSDAQEVVVSGQCLNDANETAFLRFALAHTPEIRVIRLHMALKLH